MVNEFLYLRVLMLLGILVIFLMGAGLVGLVRAWRGKALVPTPPETSQSHQPKESIA